MPKFNRTQKFTKEKIPEGTKFQYAQVKTKVRAHEVEKSIIKKEQPEFNEQHK